jgi:hypothetical protein
VPNFSNYCFHKNHLTCNANGCRKIWWISTENFRVKSSLFLVFCRPSKRVQLQLPRLGCSTFTSASSAKTPSEWVIFNFTGFSVEVTVADVRKPCALGTLSPVLYLALILGKLNGCV